MFKQSGVIRAESIHELFDFANAFAYKAGKSLGKMRRKLLAGKSIAIVTKCGRAGIIATDMTVSADLELAKLSEDTVRTWPDTALSGKPHESYRCDRRRSPDRYENALRAV